MLQHFNCFFRGPDVKLFDKNKNKDKRNVYKIKHNFTELKYVFVLFWTPQVHLATPWWVPTQMLMTDAIFMDQFSQNQTAYIQHIY